MAIRSAFAVRSMFDAVAARYDFLNHLLSAGLDRSWREVLSRRVGGGFPPSPLRELQGTLRSSASLDSARAKESRLRQALAGRGQKAAPTYKILDLCCGTGDQAFSLQGAVRGARVIGADFSLPMVDLARRKAARRGGRGPAFFGGDAMRLPFRDGTFDAATVSFGLRNLSDYDAGLREMVRVVRPGGGVFVLEFQMPTTPVVRDAYGLYFRRILPAVGAFISRSPDRAYSYLPDSVMKFPGPDELARKMEGAGLKSVSYELLTFGTVALHAGFKP